MTQLKKIKETPSGESASRQLTVKDTQSVQTENESVKHIESWIEIRKNFIKNVVSIMVEGKDFHKIKFRDKEVQVLAKGGAEKVASALGWKAEFIKDTETYEMLGSPAGTLCYICTLKNGEFVGQGRGARNIKQDAGDVNKAIKMAQKSAFIDAVLRASGLSDLFTQDLEESGEQAQAVSSYPPTEKQLEFITALMDQKRVDEKWIMEQGFTALKDLTGGKTGTASELIEFLKGHIPSETIHTTRTFEEAMPDVAFKSLSNRLFVAQSYEAIDLIGNEARIALKNKKITMTQFGELAKQAQDVRNKITA